MFGEPCFLVEQLSLDQNRTRIFFACLLLVLYMDTPAGFPTAGEQVVDRENPSLTGRNLHLALLFGPAVDYKRSMNGMCFSRTVCDRNESLGALLRPPDPSLTSTSAPLP